VFGVDDLELCGALAPVGVRRFFTVFDADDQVSTRPIGRGPCSFLLVRDPAAVAVETAIV
jgi:hypothetical protein